MHHNPSKTTDSETFLPATTTLISIATFLSALLIFFLTRRLKDQTSNFLICLFVTAIVFFISDVSYLIYILGHDHLVVSSIFRSIRYSFNVLGMILFVLCNIFRFRSFDKFVWYPRWVQTGLTIITLIVGIAVAVLHALALTPVGDTEFYETNYRNFTSAFFGWSVLLDSILSFCSVYLLVGMKRRLFRLGSSDKTSPSRSTKTDYETLRDLYSTRKSVISCLIFNLALGFYCLITYTVWKSSITSAVGHLGLRLYICTGVVYLLGLGKLLRSVNTPAPGGTGET